MFADAYMLALARGRGGEVSRSGGGGGRVVINSCDPGLVYTDLILKMPRYAGKAREETGAQTPVYVCPRTTVFVSSCYSVCVLMLLHVSSYSSTIYVPSGAGRGGGYETLVRGGGGGGCGGRERAFLCYESKGSPGLVESPWH